MGKYPGTYTTQDICKAEIKECKSILKKYNMSQKDTIAITDMILQSYLMLADSYRTGCAIEAYLRDMLGDGSLEDFFNKYITGKREPGEHLAKFIQEQEAIFEREQKKQCTFRRVK